MDTTVCNLCKKKFSSRCNLRAHVKKFHPDKLEEIAPNKTFKCEAVCNACNTTFTKYSNLQRHVKIFHEGKKELLKPREYTYQCDKCQKNFTHFRHFKSHNNKYHNHQCNFNCLNCILCKNDPELNCLQKSDLIRHFYTMHGINVETEMLQFSSLDEFNKWKKLEEKKTNELFVNAHGVTSTNNYTKIKYICHRSGTYKSKGSGLRHLKTQGSKKIGGHCPAEILVTTTDGKCEVKYVKTHVGHSNDLGHLNLTETERQTLAVQIASKIPFETILDKVRESVCNGILERVHLLTNKDLLNIERSFNINSEMQRHRNDAISVDAWVKEVEGSECVLFYKPQGELCEYPQITADDFALIIMNHSQEEILEKYGSDCICIDETHGLNAYQFNLTTLLVLDDLREGFPCCFLISNRSDEEMMYIFFTCILNKLGRRLQPKVFMSDMAPAFYNAWVRVMDVPLHRLYCTWHTDRAWRSNLNKINSKEKQIVTYKQLRTLLQETDQYAFTIMLKNFCTNLLKDPETVEFARYFESYYVKNAKSWAYCYRINSGVNTNMHIENMHRTIKYIYLNGKVNKRLDKAIHVLMKFVRDKLFNRLIVLNKGKVCAKLKELRDRHKISTTLDINSVTKTETEWLVQSTSLQEFYKIEEVETMCSNCKLVCTYCETCIHRYTCSCLDSSIKWNMCKHIHLLCRFLKDSEGNVQHSGSCPELIANENEVRIVEALSRRNKTREAEVSDKKEELKNEMLEFINSLTTSEEIDLVKNMLAPIKPTLLALRNPIPEMREKVLQKATHNKNIEQQRSIFKKNKKAIKKKVRVSKPSDTTETNIIAFSLLNS